ncbi:unnamed protein product, partial [Phaeothamnion confervicola]
HGLRRRHPSTFLAWKAAGPLCQRPCRPSSELCLEAHASHPCCVVPRLLQSQKRAAAHSLGARSRLPYFLPAVCAIHCHSSVLILKVAYSFCGLRSVRRSRQVLVAWL